MGTTLTLLYSSLTEIFYSAFVFILISFVICYSIIPIIIKKAISNNWVDQPNARKVHVNPIPSFGGIGIFVATTLAWLVPVIFDFSMQVLAIWLAGASLFVIAIIDDLIDLSPKVRFLVQLLASLLIANVGIRIENLYGLFGVHELSLVVQYILTIVIIAGFINAFNFIDGIDGLAGGLGCINAIILGVILTLVNQPLYATLSFILAMALLAFLRYNFNPAKIFMGDTGSVFIGFLLAVLAIISFNNITEVPAATSPYILAIIVVTLLIPVFDIFRTILFRVLNGNSPLQADKSHIHHLLLSIGFDHKKASIALYLSNIMLFAFGLSAMHYLEAEQTLILLFGICLCGTAIISTVRWFHLKKHDDEIAHEIETLSSNNKFLYRLMQ